jgi:integrase
MAGKAWIEQEWTRGKDKRRTGTTDRSRTSKADLKADGWKVTGYYVGMREADGKKKYKAFSNLESARTYKTDLDKELQDGRYVSKAVREEKLGDYIERMLEASHDIDRSTLKTNWNHYDNHLKGTRLANTPIGNVTTPVLQGFFNQMVANKGNGTIYHVRGLLSKALSQAVAEGILPTSPVRRVKTPKQKGQKVTAEEIERLWELTEPLADAVEPRYRAAILLAAYAGLRGGEVGGIRERDIDFPRRRITVTQQVRLVWGKAEIAPLKTDAAQRNLSMPIFLAQELQTHIDRFGVADDGRIFEAVKGGMVSHHTLNKALKKAAAAIGIEDDVPDFHDLRHVAVGLLIQTGADAMVVKTRLGHRNITTTYDVYGHLFKARDEQIADDLDRMHTSRIAAGGAVPALAEVSEGA